MQRPKFDRHIPGYKAVVSERVGFARKAYNAHNLENAFAAQLGKALAPKEVLFVGDIPKTRNAKVMRRIVRAAYLGEKLGDTSALENPASLEEIKRRLRSGSPDAG